MYANRLWMVSLVAVLVMGLAGSAAAQMSLMDPAKPSSTVGGYTSRAMDTIYRQDIGDDFTSSRIIRNTMAQSQARVPYVGQAVSSGASINPGALMGRSKPFSGVRSDPTVSPWMNMFRDDLSGEGDLNYQTLVRPQLNQQRINQQVERQNIEMGRRIQAMAAQNAFNPTGSSQMYPTGHPTAFMQFGHYYPVLSRRR